METDFYKQYEATRGKSFDRNQDAHEEQPLVAA
jgi:hypothetical protein